MQLSFCIVHVYSAGTHFLNLMKNHPISSFIFGLFLISAAVATAAPVTFQVNMEYQTTNVPPTFVPGSDTIEVRGSFNGWSSGITLSNVPGTTLYTTNIDITGFNVGDIVEYKFHAYGVSGDNWDNYQSYIYTNDGNRAFVFTGAAITLPPVYFSDQWGGQVPLTFQVDMGPQIFANNFVPGVDTVEVRGSWDNFSSGIMLTNDPNALNANLYSMMIPENSPAPGGLVAFKYHVYGSHDIWEPDPNRVMLVTNPATIMPKVYFNNLAMNDLLPQDTLVTFTVDMSGATSVLDNHVFDPLSDAVYLNGDFLNWWNWNNPPPQYQLFEVGSSYIYTNTLTLPKGTPVELNYKYGMAEGGFFAADNEAAFKVNHVRYTRAVGSYSMPQDTFGTMTLEISFGNLQIGQPSAGKIPVTWLGRPGVHLQTTADLTSSLWQEHPETDGLNSTNYPMSTGNRFFRLIKP